MPCVSWKILKLIWVKASQMMIIIAPLPFPWNNFWIESLNIKLQNCLGLPFFICVKLFIFDFFPPILHIMESQSYLAESNSSLDLVPFLILGSFFKSYYSSSDKIYLFLVKCGHNTDQPLVTISSKEFPFLLKVLNKSPLLWDVSLFRLVLLSGFLNEYKTVESLWYGIHLSLLWYIWVSYIFLVIEEHGCFSFWSTPNFKDFVLC